MTRLREPITPAPHHTVFARQRGCLRGSGRLGPRSEARSWLRRRPAALDAELGEQCFETRRVELVHPGPVRRGELDPEELACDSDRAYEAFLLGLLLSLLLSIGE